MCEYAPIITEDDASAKFEIRSLAQYQESADAGEYGKAVDALDSLFAEHVDRKISDVVKHDEYRVFFTQLLTADGRNEVVGAAIIRRTSKTLNGVQMSQLVSIVTKRGSRRVGIASQLLLQLLQNHALLVTTTADDEQFRQYRAVFITSAMAHKHWHSHEIHSKQIDTVQKFYSADLTSSRSSNGSQMLCYILMREGMRK